MGKWSHMGSCCIQYTMFNVQSSMFNVQMAIVWPKYHCMGKWSYMGSWWSHGQCQRLKVNGKVLTRGDQLITGWSCDGIWPNVRCSISNGHWKLNIGHSTNWGMICQPSCQSKLRKHYIWPIILWTFILLSTHPHPAPYFCQNLGSKLRVVSLYDAHSKAMRSTEVQRCKYY